MSLFTRKTKASWPGEKHFPNDIVTPHGPGVFLHMPGPPTAEEVEAAEARENAIPERPPSRQRPRLFGGKANPASNPGGDMPAGPSGQSMPDPGSRWAAAPYRDFQGQLVDGRTGDLLDPQPRNTGGN
jgi:hypothetical protein